MHSDSSNILIPSKPALQPTENTIASARDSCQNNEFTFQYHRKDYVSVRHKRESGLILSAVLDTIRNAPSIENHLKQKLHLAPTSLHKALSDLSAMGLIESRMIRFKRIKRVNFKNEEIFIERKIWYSRKDS